MPWEVYTPTHGMFSWMRPPCIGGGRGPTEPRLDRPAPLRRKPRPPHRRTVYKDLCPARSGPQLWPTTSEVAQCRTNPSRRGRPRRRAPSLSRSLQRPRCQASGREKSRVSPPTIRRARTPRSDPPSTQPCATQGRLLGLATDSRIRLVKHRSRKTPLTKVRRVKRSWQRL